MLCKTHKEKIRIIIKAQTDKKYQIEMISDLGSFKVNTSYWASSKDQSRIISGNFDLKFLNARLQEISYQSKARYF